MSERTYRHWNRVFERNEALTALGIPEEHRRSLLDIHAKQFCLVLHFATLDKASDGVTLVEKTWTKDVGYFYAFRKLGMDARHIRYVKSAFVFMGNIEFRFTRRER